MKGSFRGALAVLALSASAAPAQDRAAVPPAPELAVWVAGAPSSRAFFQASPESHVVVFRLLESGEIEMLYPALPQAVAAFPSARRPLATIPFDRAKAARGIYAFASFTPFDFTAVTEGSTWRQSAMRRPIASDPSAAAIEFVDRLLPEGTLVAMETPGAPFAGLAAGRYGNGDGFFDSAFGRSMFGVCRSGGATYANGSASAPMPIRRTSLAGCAAQYAQQAAESAPPREKVPAYGGSAPPGAPAKQPVGETPPAGKPGN